MASLASQQCKLGYVQVKVECLVREHCLTCLTSHAIKGASRASLATLSLWNYCNNELFSTCCMSCAVQIMFNCWLVSVRLVCVREGWHSLYFIACLHNAGFLKKIFWHFFKLNCYLIYICLSSSDCLYIFVSIACPSPVVCPYAYQIDCLWMHSCPWDKIVLPLNEVWSTLPVLPPLQGPSGTAPPFHSVYIIVHWRGPAHFAGEMWLIAPVQGSGRGRKGVT